MSTLQLKTTQVVDADNLTVGDLHLTNGQITLITDVEAVAQNVRQRLQFFRGEWFLDVREGTPYYEDVLVKNPDLSVIRAIFRDVIQGTPCIDTVPEVQVALDTRARKLEVSCTAILDTGQQVTSEDFGPFIVEI